MVRRILLCFTVLLFGLATSVGAATITFDLDYEFSGATPPAGSAPWVTATFEDLVGGGVQLTIANGGLTAQEFVSGFYFNFNPALNAALYMPSDPDLGTQTAWNFKGAGNDAWKADGDGFFDFQINFPPPPGSFGDKFTAGETFVLAWAAGTGLTANDFNFASVNGPEGKTGFYAAAHVQGIGADGNDSGWIGTGGGGNNVPEPGTMLLLGTGLIGLAGIGRKHFKK